MNQEKGMFSWEVFSLSDGSKYVLIKNEDGLVKVYDLYRFSIKYAVEDFIKYELLIKNKKQSQ